MDGFPRKTAAPATLALLLLSGLAAQTACSALGGPSASPTLVANPVDPPGQPLAVTGGVEFVRVLGSIETDNDCQQIRARVDRFSEKQLILDIAVVAETLPGCPNNQPQTWDYNVSVLDIRAGTYRLKIEHRFQNSNRESEVVFDGSVTVRAR